MDADELRQPPVDIDETSPALADQVTQSCLDLAVDQGFLQGSGNRVGRAAAGFDNAIADRLSSLFAEAGLGHVAGRLQHETARRGDPELATLAGIWTHVAGTRGRPMVAGGAITEPERATAEAEYQDWLSARAQTHASICSRSKVSGHGRARPGPH